MATFDVKEACAAFTKCNKLLLHQPPLAEEAWTAIEPYVQCTAITGKFPLGNEVLIQMLLTAAADTQAELKNPHEAARLYREAMQHEGSCAFADRYAMLVVKHKLSSHVSSALAATERLDHQWHGKSIVYRWLLWLLWFLLYVIRHPHIWKEYRMAKKHKEALQRMASTVHEVQPERP